MDIGAVLVSLAAVVTGVSLFAVIGDVLGGRRVGLKRSDMEEVA